VEKLLGLAEGTVTDLAALLAEKEKVVFLSHRGWYDPEGNVPLLLTELDRLLSGEGKGAILYLGKDCNSRGASMYARPSSGNGAGPDLCLSFGTDILSESLPGSQPASGIGGSTIIAFDTFLTRTVEKGAAAFPLPHFGEKDGTFIGAGGLEQKLTRAMVPPQGVGSLWDTLDEISEAMGKSLSFAPADSDESGEEGRAEGGRGDKVSLPSPPDVAGGKCLILRGIPVANGRLRRVEESAPLFPGKVVEVNPGDFASLGLQEGDKVSILSGSGQMAAAVKPDLKTPLGQVHLPFDPADDEMVSFASAAERPDGWPADCRRLTALEKQSPEKEG
jgi:hypothetical protein